MSAPLGRLAIRTLAALTVVAVALATGAAVAGAQAGGDITITIQPPRNAKPVTIPLSEVPKDIDTTYRLASGDGSVRSVQVKGSSVLAVLKKSQTNFDYSRIDIAVPGGGTLTITKDQITSVKPPLFYVDEQGAVRFIGPPDDDGVVPAAGQFTVSGSITLTQQAPPRLDIRVSPTKKKIKLGGAVSFKASVNGARPGETIRYEWTMRGTANGKKWERWGTVGSDSATHTQRFPRRDRLYQVRVAAWVDGDRQGSVVAVAEITVGDPKLDTKKKKGGKGSEAGSDGSGSTGGSGTGSGSGSGTYGGGSSTYSSPSYSPPPYTPEPSTSSEPDTPLEPDEPEELPDIATSDATTVEGNLLADASDSPSSLLDSAAKAARDGKSAESDGGASVPEAALSIAGVLALLGLGAGLEFREGKLPRLRVPRLPLPRRGA